MKLKKESSPVELIKKAQAALEAGDKVAARQLAHSATQNAPKSEQAWLILASLSEPEQALIYLENALRANPKSRAARKGIRLVFNQMMGEEQKKKDQALERDSLDDTAPIPVIIEQEVNQIEIEPSLLEETEDFIDNQTWKPESIEMEIGEEEETKKKLDDTSQISIIGNEEVTETSDQAETMEFPEDAEIIEKESGQPESIETEVIKQESIEEKEDIVEEQHLIPLQEELQETPKLEVEAEQPSQELESEEVSIETSESKTPSPTRKVQFHQRLAKKEAALPKINKKVILRRKTTEQVEQKFDREEVVEEPIREEPGGLKIDKVEIPEEIEGGIEEIKETVEERQPFPAQEKLQETISPIASEEIELDHVLPEKEPAEVSQKTPESSPLQKSHKELLLKRSLKKEISSQPGKKLLSKEKQKSANGKREIKVHNGSPNVDLIELILISGASILLPLLVFLYFYLSNK